LEEYLVEPNQHSLATASEADNAINGRPKYNASQYIFESWIQIDLKDMIPVIFFNWVFSESMDLKR